MNIVEAYKQIDELPQFYRDQMEWEYRVPRGVRTHSSNAKCTIKQALVSSCTNWEEHCRMVKNMSAKAGLEE